MAVSALLSRLSPVACDSIPFSGHFLNPFGDLNQKLIADQKIIYLSYSYL